MSAAAPAIRTAGPDNLTDQIELHRRAARERRYEPIGKMLNLFLGPSDNAKYAEDARTRERIASITKVRGLQLDWGQELGPTIAWSPHRSSLMFPFGVGAPPRCADPRVPGITKRMIDQNVEDLAEGFIFGRDKSRFIVLQPVLYIGVWLFGVPTLVLLKGHMDHGTGKYPALLMNPKTKEGHIFGGLWELTNARAGGGMDLPWERHGK